MGPVFPGRVLLDEAEIRFVDEGCGLQGVVRTFLVQVAGREAAQFVVDERHQLRKSNRVAAAPTLQQLRDGAWVSHFDLIVT